MTTPNGYRPTGRRRSGSRTSGAAGAAGRIRASFEGEALVGPAGASVAAALIASGHPTWRVTREGAPRGLFCGIGVCFDCIVEIDGESGQRACMIPLREGMDVRRDPGSAGAPGAGAPGAASPGAAGPGRTGARAAVDLTSTDGSDA